MTRVPRGAVARGSSIDDYLLCGWRVRSELPLPELPLWRGAAAGDPDMVIVRRELPERLDDAITPGRYLMVGADGAVLLHIVGMVRIRVRGGREIAVHLLGPEAGNAWRPIVLGAMLAFLCHQRGVLPLHAASLRIHGRTIAIAGRSGDGKSTLALGLTQRGHRLLSDDLTVLRTGAAGVDVLPAYPRLKLWRATLEAAGVSVEGLPKVRDQLEKYDLRPRPAFDPAPRPLDAIFLLDEGAEIAMTRLAARAVIPALQPHILRRRTALALGRREALFAASAQIAGAMPVYRFARPKRFDALAAAIERIEAWCRG